MNFINVELLGPTQINHPNCKFLTSLYSQPSIEDVVFIAVELEYVWTARCCYRIEDEE